MSDISPVPRHSLTDLYELRLISTPTIANALECFGINPARGYTNSEVRCFTPALGVMVGYAATSRIIGSAMPDTVHPAVIESDYWRYLLTVPGPKVAVVQDLDTEPVGSIWGEVNANCHRALGCVGMLTHGALRDTEEVERLGFFAFARRLVVSHAFVHWIEFGAPVEVAGLTIRSGELLHGDRHGVLVIPAEVPVPDLIRVARQVDRLEREVVAYCQSPGFTLDGLVGISDSVASRWPVERGGSAADTAIR